MYYDHALTAASRVTLTFSNATAPIINTGTWKRLTLVAGASSATLYVNGALHSTKAYTTGTPQLCAQSVVGARYPLSGYLTGGQAGPLVIYPSELSASQVAALSSCPTSVAAKSIADDS